MKILAFILLMGITLAAGFKVQLITPDSDITIECSPDQYILDCAEENGINLPYKGRVGADEVSTGKVVRGTVYQPDQTYLDESQIANGFALLEVAYATSDCTILTHQAENLF